MPTASDANSGTTVLTPGYDPSGHQDRVALRVTNVATDATVSPSIVYGDLASQISSVSPGTGATNLGKAENSTWAQGDVGVALLGARNDAFNNTTTSDGRYSFVQVDLTGRLITLTYGLLDPNSGTVLTNATGLFTINTNDGNSATPVAASKSTDTVIKASSGRLARVLITATGTNQMNIWDNASGHTGTIIGAIPASPSIGQVFEFMMPAANGITVQGNANNPGFTVSWT